MRRLPPSISGFQPIQRFEKQNPKIFYAPEWNLGESGKKDDKQRQARHSPLNNYGITPEKWNYLNKVVWPPNYVIPETCEPKPREVFHCEESIHLHPKKIFPSCFFAKNVIVDEAINQLRIHQTKPTLILADVIEKAKERAESEFFIENPGICMFVAEAFARQSKIIKGAKRHAHERWHPMRYRYIHLFVRLQEGEPPPFKGREPESDGWDKMNDYYDYLRSRDFKYSI